MNNHRRRLLSAPADTPLVLSAQAAASTNVAPATCRFANPANLQLSKAEPAKHGPQHGGYRAYGIAQGVKPGIPRVIDGANRSWPGLKGQ